MSGWVHFYRCCVGVFAVWSLLASGGGGGGGSTSSSPPPAQPAELPASPPPSTNIETVVVLGYDAASGIAKTAGQWTPGSGTLNAGGQALSVQTETLSLTNDIGGVITTNSSDARVFGIPASEAQLTGQGTLTYVGAADVVVTQATSRAEVRVPIRLSVDTLAATGTFDLDDGAPSGAIVTIDGVRSYAPTGQEVLSIEGLALTQGSLQNTTSTTAQVSGFGEATSILAAPVVDEFQGQIVGSDAEGAIGIGVIDSSTGSAFLIFGAAKSE